MVDCDAVIMSFLDGHCLRIVEELQELAQKQMRDPPLFALVSRRTPSEMASDLSAFDVTSTGRDIDGGSKQRHGTRQRVLKEIEHAIIAAKLWKHCGWERYPADPITKTMWLYKNVRDEKAPASTFDSKKTIQWNQREGWRWFSYKELNAVAKRLPRWAVGPGLVEFMRQKEIVDCEANPAGFCLNEMPT